MLIALASDAGAQPAASNVLFYTHPAREWNQALPLGNGRLGAMVFGNVNAERIQLNENSLWMGGPRDTNNPDALKHLAEVRRLLFAGLPVEAYAVAEKYSMGRPFRLESYQSLGDLRLTFEHEGTPADYRFELDIDSAIARLTLSPRRRALHTRSVREPSGAGDRDACQRRRAGEDHGVHMDRSSAGCRRQRLRETIG